MMVVTKKAMLLFGAVSMLLFTIVNGSQALRFTVEPYNVVVAEGSSVLLPCKGEIVDTKLPIKGKNHKNSLDSLPDIRWRGPDGQDIGIVGDTFRIQLENGSLYISSVEENRGLTGAYQCLFSIDGIGTIVSRSAVVSISKLPETNNIFSEMYLFPGQTAYFKCLNATLLPANLNNYQIQWLKDDIPLQIDETRMIFFPSGAIEIDELTAFDKGTYQCNVTSGSFYKHSSKTYLNIKSVGDPQTFQAPHFLTETASQTIIEGSAITLDCVANGNPKPQIKWLRNGEDIDISDLDSRFRIIGTGSLQIASVEDSDSGNYQCRASNSMDSTDIQISVEVQVPPKFIQSPTDKIAYEKEELEMACSIRGKPTPIIQWLKNGDVITPNDYMQIVNGHNLRILGLLESDAGMFQCIGSNKAGSVQAAARLQIGEPKGKQRKKPKQPKKKVLKKIQAKDEALHTSIEEAADSPAYHGGATNIQMKNSFHGLLASNDPNKLLSSEPSDSELNSDDYNDYDDSDDEGTIHSLEPNVNPNVLLKELTEKQQQQQQQHNNNTNNPNLNSDENLSAFLPNSSNLDGDNDRKAAIPGPPRDLVTQTVNRFVSLSWMEPAKNPDEVISYSVFYKMNTSDRERKITTKSRDEQMINIQLLPGKTYQVRVIGNSNYGPGESSAILEVSTQPEENIAGPAQNVIGNAISHKEIHIKWEPPLVTNGNITKYRVYYPEPDGIEMFVDTTELELILVELRPFTEYSISVVPFNENGMGDSSREILVKTYSSTPDDAPVNVTLEATSSTSITVRWEPPPIEEQNGPITGYKIRYRKHKKQVQVETTPANVRHYELRELDKKSSYQVKMAAMTINGTGPFTEWNTIETYESDLTEAKEPGKPAFIHTRATSNSILIKWGAPERLDIKVRSYVLGYGIGIPDVDTIILDEKLRFYEIKDLQSNSEYVLSLRARNMFGDGEPQYGNIQTRDEDPIESAGTVLEVPVRLRAITMSSTSIVVYWTDNSVSRGSHMINNRIYMVRHNPVDSNRYKYYNTSELNCMIDDLRPNTQYEFAVKTVKGRRESAWSMSEVNTTFPLSPVSPPRDLKAQPESKNPQNILLKWLPPRNNNGQINGYLVFYTTEPTNNDIDWKVEAVAGEKSEATIKNLNPHTIYYFKVQTRNVNRSPGTFSATISHMTGHLINLPGPIVTVTDVIQSGTIGSSNGGLAGKIFNEYLIYIIAGILFITLVVSARVVMILCRRKPQGTPEGKHGYSKGNTGMKPPDLWIHHDQMELKNVDKNPPHPDGASSSGAMTLPRSSHEYESDMTHSHVSNSLDKRSYVPGYMTTSMNSTMERTSQYPRAYNRMHIDPNAPPQMLNQTQVSSIPQTPENPYSYDSMPSNYSNPSITYAPGLSIDVPKAARGQGHPLQSFSVPGPPPPSLNTTPLISNPNKHNVPAVAIRPQNASPYKKSLPNTVGAPIGPISLTNTLTNRLQQSGPIIAHSADEIQRLAPSTSTEELNQEMANLEGLMKDLSAITASEFEC